MKTPLSDQERLFLIDKLQKGESLPSDFKEKLFPTIQKEYELAYAGKMRKEDILANEDGVSPVPLQVEKVYNGEREAFIDGWRNMVVFGDNLQFLKTCYKNEDELIKDRIKGKVKLIYIDPPFGTASDFDSNSGQIAYSDKAKGADFVEFIRKRLLVAKELLANDGSVFVHLDYKKIHYIKLILDEVFGENNFRNEIVWKRKGGSANPQNRLGVVTDSILWYSKTDGLNIHQQFTLDSDEVKKYIKERFNNVDENGRKFLKSPIVSPNPRENLTYEYKGFSPPRNGWSISKELMEKWDKEGKLYFPKEGSGDRIYRKIYIDEYQGQPIQNLWNDIFVINPMSLERLDYPTQKPEDLLKRVLLLSTNENDLVLDFFGGSGTTAAVAEKLGRRWVTCDIGKLSFYTIQKRLLQIQDSKDLQNSSRKYGKQAKTFVTVNTGVYDLNKVFALNQEKYKAFVLNLFEVENKQKIVNGIKFDGERYGYLVMIWDFWEYQNVSIDEPFLENLHISLKNRVGSRVYLIAPANSVDFISDYHEIDTIRYYFLKVPYHIINELHKVDFKKFRQPQSKNKINDLEDAVGFHFMRQPEVVAHIEENQLCIKKFRSLFSEEETGKEMENFESLSMILIDENFNGKDFVMSKFVFAEDLIKIKKKKQEDAQNDGNLFAEQLREELKQQQDIRVKISPTTDKIFVVYVDIYGNEFKEDLKINS